jgi:hypothetical protein
MSLPPNERHRPNRWILQEKRKINGVGLHGSPVITNLTTFNCDSCHNTYTRFVNDKEYEDLEVGFSNWSWGWVR